jgi:phenylalanyl-tRNA synthetase alpha chain
MSDLNDRLAALAARLDAAAAQAADEKALDDVRVTYLGRSGEVTAIRRSIGELPPAERPTAGKTINDAVLAMEAAIDAARGVLERKKLDAMLADTIDVTFPPKPAAYGSLHPLRRTIEDAVRYFERHGFAVVVGPELETDENNFDALNIPPDHPAREGHDSFYLDGIELLLRTHTSPAQVRSMRAHPAPIAIVNPGRAYRRDEMDARHSYMFFQMEGLLVAPGVHFGHLRGMLTGMCRELFGAAQAVRFRPSFFPFTEPSAEVDTTCPGCGGTGCKTCSGSGWIEIGGAGMVHPNVLRNVGYDPTLVTGWAFGVGVERIAMTRYGIDDIRNFYDNDPAFLAQLA